MLSVVAVVACVLEVEGVRYVAVSLGRLEATCYIITAVIGDLRRLCGVSEEVHRGSPGEAERCGWRTMDPPHPLDPKARRFMLVLGGFNGFCGTATQLAVVDRNNHLVIGDHSETYDRYTFEKKVWDNRSAPIVGQH